MKKLINVTLGAAIMLCMLTSISTPIFANVSSEMDSAGLLGMSGREYATEAQAYPREKQEREGIKDITVSSDRVVLEHNGLSEFIDVIGELENGEYVPLTNEVTWASDNDDVVYADAGRILAMASGVANVTVQYRDIIKTINVSVSDSLDIAGEIERLNAQQSGFSSNGFSSSDRTTVISNAKGMVELQWTPTKNVRGWRNNKTFTANTTYTGIPYSQTEYQKNKDGFNTALKASDFYNNYTRFDIIMPKYGNDCSGFVSFSWGISRKTTGDFVDGIKDGTYAKVGSYNADSPTASSLKTAYKSLQKADAVVKSGHTFLIASNDTANSKVYAYEQTPYLAQYTSWTYSTMASDGYMPFTKN